MVNIGNFSPISILFFTLNWAIKSILDPLHEWLSSLEIKDQKIASFLSKVIPGHCPFERKIRLFGYMVTIPAMCKLNPFYEDFMRLRFLALDYLANEFSEDSRNTFQK